MSIGSDRVLVSRDGTVRERFNRHGGAWGKVERTRSDWTVTCSVCEKRMSAWSRYEAVEFLEAHRRAIHDQH